MLDSQDPVVLEWRRERVRQEAAVVPVDVLRREP